MCMRDGFHTFQSRHISTQSKLSAGSTLEKTHILFKHHKSLVNPILKLASSMKAFGNFDPALNLAENN